MIQVRNVSDKLHKELVRRAKLKGLTLSAYIEDLLEREIERPPAEEVFERIRRLPRVKLSKPAAEYLREEREEREEHLSHLIERRRS
jgi:hypothetical protein